MPRREPLTRGTGTRPDRPGGTFLRVLAAGLLAGCGGADAVPVTPPVPDEAAAAACAQLRDALPEKVDEGSLRGTEPSSPLTAAWRDPPVVLRCGVPPVDVGATAQLRTVNDVDWFTADTEVTGPHVYTTVGRVANVELTVPDGRMPAGALVDLAEPIKRALPPAEAPAPVESAAPHDH